jgi:hypothetical protein
LQPFPEGVPADMPPSPPSVGDNLLERFILFLVHFEMEAACHVMNKGGCYHENLHGVGYLGKFLKFRAQNKPTLGSVRENIETWAGFDMDPLRAVFDLKLSTMYSCIRKIIFKIKMASDPARVRDVNRALQEVFEQFDPVPPNLQAEMPQWPFVLRLHFTMATKAVKERLPGEIRSNPLLSALYSRSFNRYPILRSDFEEVIAFGPSMFLDYFMAVNTTVKSLKLDYLEPEFEIINAMKQIRDYFHEQQPAGGMPPDVGSLDVGSLDVGSLDVGSLDLDPPPERVISSRRNGSQPGVWMNSDGCWGMYFDYTGDQRLVYFDRYGREIPNPDEVPYHHVELPGAPTIVPLNENFFAIHSDHLKWWVVFKTQDGIRYQQWFDKHGCPLVD